MASSYAVTRAEIPNRHRANLSIVVAAEAALRWRCQTILTEHGISSRGAALARADRMLRRHRPRVLLLDAGRSPRRALGALPRLRRVSAETAVVLLGRRRPSTTFLLESVRRGARGHVAEADLPRLLPRLVHAVAAGETWLPRRLCAPIVAELIAHGCAGGLPTATSWSPHHVRHVDTEPRRGR
jgi:DNA-binding NarL/FixJ family response regulator